MCFFPVSMQNHSRTPKTCFTLGLECLCLIYSQWDNFENSPRVPNHGEKKASIYKGNLFGFEMGLSVKFVSAIIDAFSNKKRGAKINKAIFVPFYGRPVSVPKGVWFLPKEKGHGGLPGLGIQPGEWCRVLASLRWVRPTLLALKKAQNSRPKVNY